MTRLRPAALALFLAGCASTVVEEPPPAVPCTASGAVPATVVAMVAGVMNPDCIQVTRGASVEFVNQDLEMHTATDQAAVPAFDLLLPPGSAERTPPLDGPGTIVASCTFHPAMQVTIFVP